MLSPEKQKELDRFSVKFLFALFAVPSLGSAALMGTLAASLGTATVIRNMITDDKQETTASHLLSGIESGIIKIQATPQKDGATTYSLVKPSGDAICEFTADEQSLTTIEKIIKRNAALNSTLTEGSVLSIVNKCADEIKAVSGITISERDQDSLREYADKLAQTPQPMVVTANNNVSLERLKQEIGGAKTLS